jgi:hypothetical protein
MITDPNYLQAVGAAIAREAILRMDEEEPKAKLSDSLRRVLSLMMRRSDVAQLETEAKNPSAGREPLKNWV